MAATTTAPTRGMAIRKTWENALYRLFVEPLQKVKTAKEKARLDAAIAAYGEPTPRVESDLGADPYEFIRRRRRAGGRASTILTGDLVPMDIGKRTLLG